MSKPKPPDYGPMAKAQLQAAKIQAASHDRAIGEFRRQYDQTRDDYSMYRDIGKEALKELSEGGKEGRFDPGKFEFNYQESKEYLASRKHGEQAYPTSC